MGQEITYCFHCQVRLTGADFKESKALRFGNRVSCTFCLPQLLEILTPQERKEVVSQLDHTSNQKGAPPCSPARTPLTPGSQLPGKADPGGPSKQWVIWGVLGAAAILVAIATAVSSKRPEPPRTVPESSGTPPIAQPAVTGRSPREKEAEEVLARARALPPSDLKAKIAKYEEVLRLAEGTPLFKEVREDHAALLQMSRRAFAKEVSALRQRANQLATQEQFQAAINLILLARSSVSPPDEPERIDEIVSDLRQEADRAYSTLRNKAAEAFRQNDSKEVAAIRDRIALWGLKDKLSEFDVWAAGLSAPAETPKWRALFDGKSLGCLQEGGKGWQIEENALIQSPASGVSARTLEEFGDAELRVRFESKALESLYFKLRQGHGGGYALDLAGSRLKVLDGKTHELLFVATGDQVRAALDGNPVKIETESRAPRGCLQIVARGESLKIYAIDVR
jgi:hypothetical protein